MNLLQKARIKPAGTFALSLAHPFHDLRPGSNVRTFFLQNKETTKLREMWPSGWWRVAEEPQGMMAVKITLMFV